MVIVQRSVAADDIFSGVLNGKQPLTGKQNPSRTILFIKLLIMTAVPFAIFLVGAKFGSAISGSQVRSAANKLLSPEPASTERLSVVKSLEDGMIKFNGFNDDLIPPNTVLDINIGTNMSPMRAQDGRYRILVDPLFAVCDNNAKMTTGVSAFCMAVANYTGFATFNEYNPREGTGRSSSLAHVQPGTSHERFEVLSKRTVLVLEAAVLLSAIQRKNTQIHRLKLDMQGFELSVLTNVLPLLRDSDLVVHVMAECFYPNKDGLQIYTIDNSCEKIAALLKNAGYVTKDRGGTKEYSDVVGYKMGLAADFELKW
jgi:FkbM family methyltransferase